MALSLDQIRKLKRGDLLWVIKQHGRGSRHFVGTGRLLRRGTVGCSLVGVSTLSKGSEHPEANDRWITATFAELVIPFE